MKLGIIGCGKMGSALLSGAVEAGAVEPSDLQLCSASGTSAQALAQETGGTVASLDEVAAIADVVLICTKPADVLQVLNSLSQTSRARLVISVAAGVTTATMERHLGSSDRVVRCMPNTPSLVGKGAAGFCGGVNATQEDLATTAKILGSVGIAVQVKESLIDAVTGVSGSGPAYIYTIIEAMADGGVKNGLPRAQALELATQTVLGAAQMVAETGDHPAVLRDNVTSPGGTTIAGLAALEAGNLRSTMISGVDAAVARAKELGASE